MDLQNKYAGKWTFRKDRNGAVEAFTEVVSGVSVTIAGWNNGRDAGFPCVVQNGA